MQLYHPTRSTAIVSAAQIIDVLDGVKSSFNPLGWRGLRLQRHNVLLPTPDGWLEQHRPKPGDYLVQDTEGRSKIVPEQLFLGGYHRASPADESEHPAWSLRTHEEPTVAPPMPYVKAELSPDVLDALIDEMAKPSRMQLEPWPPQPVDVVPGLRVITDAPDKVPDGCSVVVITVEGDPWWKYAVTRQWFEDYKPQVGGGLVPVEGDVPLYYPPGSFKPALPTRVTKEALEAMFCSVTYEIRPDGRTTVCEITFKNGFSLRDESSAATIDNFKQDIGEQLAYEKALDAAWGFAGFLLLEDRYRASLGGSAA